MLGPIVRIIELSWTPINAKFLLAFSIAQPMETHVHRLGVFRLYFAVIFHHYTLASALQELNFMPPLLLIAIVLPVASRVQCAALKIPFSHFGDVKLDDSWSNSPHN